MIDISFIILTWNSQKTIKGCIESIRDICLAENVSFEIIIVDNKSTDGTQSIFNSFQQQIKMSAMQMDRNYGTTYTRNLAMKHVAAECICFLDSDTKLIGGDITDILKKLKSDKNIGIIAPKLILPNGEIAVTVKKFPTFMDKFIKLIFLLLFGKDRHQYRGDYCKNFPFEKEKDVDTAISACWFFKKTLMDEIGYLDEKIFFGPEDIEFCLRVWKAGKRVVYYPYFTVLHCAQSLARIRPFSRIMLNHILGLLHIFIRHRYFFRRPKTRRAFAKI